MAIYASTLAILGVGVAAAATQHFRRNAVEHSLLPGNDEQGYYEVLDDELHDLDHDTTADRYYAFLNRFLPVYVLAIAADWLQVGGLLGGSSNNELPVDANVPFRDHTHTVSIRILTSFRSRLLPLCLLQAFSAVASVPLSRDISQIGSAES